MKKIQLVLTIALLFTALLVFAFFGTNVLSGPIEFLYSRAAGFTTFQSIAQIAAQLSALGLFIAAAIIALAAALKPARWARKMLYVLPGVFLGLALVGVIMMLAGIGTTVPFALIWLAATALLAAVAVLITAARVDLGAQFSRAAALVLGVTAVPSLVTAVAVVASVAIVATSQPSRPTFGPNPQGAPGNQNPPAFSTTPGAPRAQRTPAAATTPSAQRGPGDGEEGGFPSEGPGGRGGFGGQANLVRTFEIGGGLVAVLALGALVTTVGGVRQIRDMRVAELSDRLPIEPLEMGRAALGALGVGVLLFALIQLVPVPRTNPPVQTTVQWDSPQTETLFYRACASCHTNETVYPWYAYVAPSSWLTAMDVTSGRREWNLSELNKLPSFRRAQLANDIAQRIRNGTMPLPDYRLLHPEAQLTDAEKQALIQGMRNTLANQQ